MKKTEVAPGAESNDFRFGVNGFPKPGGLYRLGDNGAIPPHRLYRGWNIQFNGDEIAERGGQSEFCDTASTYSVTGIFSSNDGWPDDPGFSGGTLTEDSLRWGRFATNATAPDVTLETETSWNPTSGLQSVDINYDGSFSSNWTLSTDAWRFLPDAPRSVGSPASYGQLLRGVNDKYVLAFPGVATGYPFNSISSAVHYNGTLVIAEYDDTTPTARIAYTTPKTLGTYAAAGVVNSESYDAASWTTITDSGLTIDNSASGTATTVASGPLLFVFQGSLFAMYSRKNGAPKGLLRRWSSGTTWTTVGTFPTLTVRDNAGGDFTGWRADGFGRATAEFEGNLYIAIHGSLVSATSNNGVYNSVFVLKFTGTAITEFYNYAPAGGIRATVVAGSATGAGIGFTSTDAVNSSLYKVQDRPQIFSSQAGLFLSFWTIWYPAAGTTTQMVWACVYFGTSTGSLAYTANSITTPNYFPVEGSTKPTFPIDTTTGGFSTTYPDWYIAPWSEVVKVGGYFFGRQSSPLALSSPAQNRGYAVCGTDNTVWIYRSLDGLAWYKYIKLIVGDTTDVDNIEYASSAPMAFVMDLV